jgi:hypothetical protein
MKEVGSIRELREQFCCEEPLGFGSEAEVSALMSESESSTKQVAYRDGSGSYRENWGLVCNRRPGVDEMRRNSG